jgi:Zn-dependent protease
LQRVTATPKSSEEYPRPTKQRDESEKGSAEGPSYHYRVDYEEPSSSERGRGHSSSTEIIHLLVALGLLALFSFSIFVPLYLLPFFTYSDWTTFNWISFLLLTGILFLSFLPHELMHKFAAQRYGLFAEFRIIPYYAFMTAVFLFFPYFKIFAPGAVMIGGYASPKEYGKTAAAGPATNLVMGAVMAALAFILPEIAGILFIGVYLSGWLALFNMIPVAPLDGEKILRWSRPGFAVLFLGSIALFAYGFI